MRRLIKAFGLLAVTLTAAALFGSGHSYAYSNSNIIDDSVFDNSSSMSTADIQNFLNQYSGSCLKSYSAPDPQSWYNYGALVPAAQVIKDASTIWGINPRVLLTKLQAEEGLVEGSTYGCTDTSYWSAMGYDCPSSTTYTWTSAQATASPNNYAGGVPADMQGSIGPTCVKSPIAVGFSAQVNHAAWQLEFGRQRSEGNGNLTWDGDDDIVYYGYMTQGTRARCLMTATPVYCDNTEATQESYSGSITLNDGTTLTIDNGATASLYSYTPFITTGQSFDTIYEGFFGAGSTSGVPYQWQFAGQTSSADLTNLLPGQTATLTATALNAGNTTWYNSGSNPVRLGTSNPNDRLSAFCTTGWLGCNRPATMNETSVAPGADATFTFTITAPNAPGTYREYFNLLAEGITWMNDPGMYYYIVVQPPIYSYSVSSQAAYTDNTKTTPVNLTQLSPGQTAWLVLTATNTGNMTWANSGANPVDLGTDSPRNGSSRFATSAWMEANRPARLEEASVAPGATGTFEFPIQVPAGNGAYDAYFTPVAEGITWMNETGLNYHTVINGQYSWSLVSQYAYTDNTKTTPVSLTSLTAGETVFIGLTAKNTGTATWYNSGAYPMDLGTSHPQDRLSAFCATGWMGCNRPVRMKEASVAPGATGTFEFNYTAPATAGTYDEYFDPVAESITWLNDIGLYFYTVVQ